MSNIKLLPHQKETLKQTAGFQNVAVFHDMGLGKTFTGSEIMFRFGTVLNMVVCQKSKVQDWVDHFKDHYPSVRVFNLTEKGKVDELMVWSVGWQNYHGTSTTVAIINYELAWRRKDLLELGNFTLMLDESSLIQNPKAKQTKFILKLKPSHCILLSGSPVGGKYENLWTQLHLLGWDISKDLYDKQYVNWKLIEAGGITHKIVDKENPYKNVDRLKQKLRDHGSVFLKTEDVIDLPEQTFTQVLVKPTKEYWKFQKNSIVTVEGLELIGDTSLTKMMYSRQLCGQFNQEKMEAFKDLIESTQDRLVVFYNFNMELLALKEICHELGRPVSEVNGHCKDLTAYENCSDSVIFCQYQSASMGLNLQKSYRIIYYTLPLSSEHFEQSKKRIHRIGQKNHCFYYLLICKGTVEEQILKTLNERKDFTDELFKENQSENS